MIPSPFGVIRQRMFRSIVPAQTLGLNNVDGSAYGFRQQIKSAVYGGSYAGSSIRVTFTPVTSGTTSTVTSVWVGHAGTAPNMDGNQVQLFFSGSAALSLISGGSPIVSDVVKFAFDPTKDLIVSLAITVNHNRGSVTATNFSNWYKVNDQASVALTSVSGYTEQASVLDYMSQVEIIQ